MPSSTAFRSPAVQNLIAAGFAGAGVLLRPARFPRWARRSLSAANMAGTAASLLGNSGSNPNSKQALGLKPTKTTTGTAAASGSALAAAAGGLSMMSSGIGLRIDRKVEQRLVDRGVKHPRIVMAVGVIVVVFIAKTIEDYATAKAQAAAKNLAGKADSQPPAGSDLATSKTSADKQLASTPVASTFVASDGGARTSAAAASDGSAASATDASQVAEAADTTKVADAAEVADASGSLPSSSADTPITDSAGVVPEQQRDGDEHHD